jgi:hypothetical protein
MMRVSLFHTAGPRCSQARVFFLMNAY